MTHCHHVSNLSQPSTTPEWLMSVPDPLSTGLSFANRRYDRMKSKEGRVAPQDITKQCTQCGEAKPGTGFSPNTTSPDGLRSNCKDCQSRAAARCRRQRAVPVEQRFYDEAAEAAGDRQPHEVGAGGPISCVAC